MGGHARVRRLLIAAALVAVGGCAGTTSSGGGAGGGAAAVLSGEAALKDKDGKQVGVATLIETSDGVRVAVTGYRLPPGPHGLHIHAVGLCEPPEFTSAGPHFNPAGKK